VPSALGKIAGLFLCVSTVFACGPLIANAPAEPSWPTYHRDAIRSGDDPDATEPIEPVQAWQTADLGAPIWGQPLVQGNRVYVATVGNDLYSLDAATGEQIWKRHLGMPVPAGQLPCGDVVPTVGIVGTPVIDPATGKIFAVADTWNATTKEAAHVLKGFTLAGKLVLTTPVDPPESDPKAMLERTALNLDQGHVIFGFGGNRGDCSDYQGTIVSAPEAKGAASYWRYQPAPPSTSGGAVWAPAGVAVDAAGDIFAATGNPNPPSGSKAETYDYSSSLIQLDSGLNLAGHFQPPTWLTDVNSDLDLGSAGPELLPGGLIFQAGKNGTGYLLDASTLGEGAAAVYSHQVCNGHGSFGGDAYAGGVIYIPCTIGVEALAYNQAERTFTQVWQGPSDAFGPPIVSGGLVWVAATGGFAGGGTKLYGLDPATGKPVYTETLPSPIADHFGSPSAAGGRLFMATGSTVTAYQISALSPPPAPPTAETGEASSIAPTAAVLNGTVDPNGSTVTDCHFDYGPTEQYGASVPCEPLPGAGSSAEAVAATLEGLAPSTTYHFRLVATGMGGTGTGADHTLQTPAPPAPSVVTGEATAVSDTSATLNATVDPNGFEVSDCHFEYGPSEAYGATVPCAEAPGSGTSAVAVSAAVTGLTGETTYHFKIVAAGEGGSSSGSDATLTTLSTPPPAPEVLGEAPTSVTQTSAQLHATVNPEGAEVTDCHFDYGATEAYGSAVACTPSPGSGSTPVAVTGALAGLAPGTTYHLRISATGPGGTSMGADQTVTTLQSPPPQVLGEAPTAVTQTSAQLHATVNPKGAEVTDCHFDYGATEAYGSAVACTPSPGSGSTPVAVSGALAGLAPGTIYHLRISATGPGGTSMGADQTVTTLEPPPPPPPPAVSGGVASSITQSSAQLNAFVNPNGSPVTECRFEYGASSAYGSSVPCATLPGMGSTPVAVSAPLAGLSASTVYHFRIVATGAGGKGTGADSTLRTAAPLASPAPGPGPGSPPAAAGTPPRGSQAVLSAKHEAPAAMLASTFARVGRSGALVLRIRCASGASACIGRLVLRTLGPIARGSSARRRGPIAAGGVVLVLARTTFSLVGGQTRPVTLHLGARARALLARRHPLRARLSILAHDRTGARHGSHVTILLHLAPG
jgi:outer membrane protein assembly factor BamB/phosphodiesterase/alkaline phosphatase D-like protein